MAVEFKRGLYPDSVPHRQRGGTFVERAGGRVHFQSAQTNLIGSDALLFGFSLTRFRKTISYMSAYK